MNVFKLTTTKRAFSVLVVIGLLASIGVSTPIKLIAQGVGQGNNSAPGHIPGHCPDGYEKIEYEGSSWTADQNYDSVILVGGAPNADNNNDPVGRFKNVGPVKEGETVSRDEHDISFVCVKPGESVETPEPPVDPEPEYVTIVATKILCPEASMLPKNTGTYEVNENTASSFLIDNTECELMDGWKFQWSFETPVDSPDNRGELSNWNTSAKTGSDGRTEMVISEEELASNSRISVREVWSDDHIEFAGLNGSGESAEFYCETDGKNLDNFEYIFDAQPGETYHCVAWNVPTEEEAIPEPVPQFATVVAHKIVCEDEDQMPRYGAGGDYRITENTATDWVKENDSCELVNGWKFQWAPDHAENPGDNVNIAGDPWITFDHPTTVNGKATLKLSAEDIEGMDHIWIREAMKNGYIQFTHGSHNENDRSAEMYCHSDVLNYDNYERIDGIEVGNTYHCVAWNMKEVKDEEEKPVYQAPSENRTTPSRSGSISGTSIQATPIMTVTEEPEGMVAGIEDSPEEEEVRETIIPIGAPDTGMGGTSPYTESGAWAMILAVILLITAAFIPTRSNVRTN